ncbi:hypothetical protein ABPG74_022277 [Tetrahymena malaccensis]
MSMIEESEINYIKNYNLFQNSVFIIGAGPAGILNTKYISQNNNVLCVDGKSSFGGLWKFEDLNEFNHPSIHTDAFYNSYGHLQSSLYEDLQCNGCKVDMCFKGQSYSREYQEFIQSEQFYEYMQTYVKKNNIQRFMAFNTFVQSVRLTKNLTQEEKATLNFEPTKRFVIELVQSNDFNLNKRFLQADYVIVCTGHYSVPNYPTIPDQQIFSGDIIHAHNFRKIKISQYANHHLVIYGAALSSQDIVLILLRKSGNLRPSKITVIGEKSLIEPCQKSEAYSSEIAEGRLVYKSGYIAKYNSSNSLVLSSGETIENVDFVLYATGYQYSYPFLEKNKNIDNLIEFYNARKNSLGPLYRRMFAVNEPNLIFIGTVQTVYQLQACLERQAIIAARYIDKIISLPDQKEMENSFQQDFEEAKKLNQDGRYYLRTSENENGFTDYKFTQQLQELAQVPFDEEFIRIHNEIIAPRYNDIFKHGNYPVLKQLDFKEVINPDYAPKEGLF